MNNQAYKWLTEWVENGGDWKNGSVAWVWYLYRSIGKSYSSDFDMFRNDLRQLLADAEEGRKMREGV